MIGCLAHAEQYQPALCRRSLNNEVLISHSSDEHYEVRSTQLGHEDVSIKSASLSTRAHLLRQVWDAAELQNWVRIFPTEINGNIYLISVGCSTLIVLVVIHKRTAIATAFKHIVQNVLPCQHKPLGKVEIMIRIMRTNMKYIIIISPLYLYTTSRRHVAGVFLSAALNNQQTH